MDEEIDEWLDCGTYKIGYTIYEGPELEFDEKDCPNVIITRDGDQINFSINGVIVHRQDL